MFTSFIYYYKKVKEYFLGNVYFLTKIDTEQFLLRDNDGYISNLTSLDLIARGASTHNMYRIRSASSATSFNLDQQNTIERATIEADIFFSSLKNPYINSRKITELQWRFALTTDKKYEQGLPHTRESIIFLDDSIFDVSFQKLTQTLIHEKIHVYQRIYREEFINVLYNEEYKIWIPRKGYPRVRSNPDLDNFIYIHPTKQIMVAIYENNKPKNIEDVIMPNNLHEHPFEEIAYKIAAMYK